MKRRVTHITARNDTSAWISLSLKRLLFAVVFCNALIVSLWAIDWPVDGDVVTEFSSLSSALQPGVPSPFMAMSAESGGVEAPEGELIFSGALTNGLGATRVYAQANDWRFGYANLAQDQDEQGGAQSSSAGEQGAGEAIAPVSELVTAQISTWSQVRKPLIFFAFDTRRRRIVNPELLFDNPPDNRQPSLRRLRFAQLDERGTPGTYSDLWSWVRRAAYDAGEYAVLVDWADGRFVWNDVEQIFVLRFYVNGQLVYNRDLEFFEERDGKLGAPSDVSVFAQSIPVTIRPGENNVEVYLEDPKGLSQAYEFSINGGTAPPE